MKIKYKLLTLTVMLFFSFAVFNTHDAKAHPGRTDKNGGHYCKTNCKKWGLKYGQYHYHSKR